MMRSASAIMMPMISAFISCWARASVMRNAASTRLRSVTSIVALLADAQRLLGADIGDEEIEASSGRVHAHPQAPVHTPGHHIALHRPARGTRFIERGMDRASCGAREDVPDRAANERLPRVPG